MRVSSSLQDIRGRTCEKDSASVDSLFVTMLGTPGHRSANVVDGGRKRRLWRKAGSEITVRFVSAAKVWHAQSPVQIGPFEKLPPLKQKLVHRLFTPKCLS
jgi:hypothetical protein